MLYITRFSRQLHSFQFGVGERKNNSLYSDVCNGKRQTYRIEGEYAISKLTSDEDDSNDEPRLICIMGKPLRGVGKIGRMNEKRRGRKESVSKNQVDKIVHTLCNSIMHCDITITV